MRLCVWYIKNLNLIDILYHRNNFFALTLEFVIYVHKKYSANTKTTSPITTTTERAVTNENNDFFGFEYIGKEYEEADMNTVNKNFLIENSRAIFDEIEKERSARDSQIDLFFHDNDSDSVLNFSHFSSNFDPSYLENKNFGY